MGTIRKQLGLGSTSYAFEHGAVFTAGQGAAELFFDDAAA
jgi:hypothetical protein